MPEKVTIDVDLGPLASEWEVVAIRPAKPGEFYLQSWPESAVALSPIASAAPYVIVRRRWKWPAGLKCAAIAMDKNRRWFAHATRPILSGDEWRCVGGGVELRDWQIDLPAVDDWRDSLRLNPNREKAA